jgi:hypothetical protein
MELFIAVLLLTNLIIQIVAGKVMRNIDSLPITRKDDPKAFWVHIALQASFSLLILVAWHLDLWHFRSYFFRE